MHCNGVIGEQFLHSASNDLDIPDEGLGFSVLGISDNIVNYLLSGVGGFIDQGKEGMMGADFFFWDWFTRLNRRRENKQNR